VFWTWQGHICSVTRLLSAMGVYLFSL
jgi:hypothetical protein